VKEARVLEPELDPAMARVAQLVMDCHECEGPIDDPVRLERLLRDAAKSVGATVLDVARCDYVPHGVTMVAFLAESHLLVTTWPEHRFAIVEIMLCNGEMNPWDLHALVCATLAPRRTVDREIVHRMYLHERP
jgi:S-adenosylmethionine decarboxylase